MTNGKVPEWLRARWERTKSETAARVQAAVDQLRERGRGVTFESIRETIRSMHGVSISANTIKRNELAYQIYSAHRQRPKMASLPQPALRALVANASDKDRHGLQSKISRLRREPKDSLVAKLVCLERTVAKQGDIENRLREEILRLSTPR
jgi:multidrug efflux pump subunit AcrB